MFLFVNNLFYVFESSHKAAEKDKENCLKYCFYFKDNPTYKVAIIKVPTM